MTEQLNLICIFCHVSLDGIDQSIKTDAQKIILQNHINHLFNIAFNNIGQTNRIILVTDSGAEIAYLGALEDAMLMAKEIVSSIVVSSKQGAAPLSICIGIHSQAMRETHDFSQHPNIISNGINSAKQAMVEARPNEIIVSDYCNETVSAFNQARSTKLNDQLDSDKNQIFESNLAGLNLIQNLADNQETVFDLPVNLKSSVQTFEYTNNSNESSWKYALASLFMVVLLFLLVELAIMPADLPYRQVKALPTKAIQSSNLNKETLKSKKFVTSTQQANNDGGAGLALPKASGKKETVKPSPAKKKVGKKSNKSIDAVANKANRDGKFGWESLKKSIMQGQKKECTQAENALNQCQK